jgi:hypothetical protein
MSNTNQLSPQKSTASKPVSPSKSALNQDKSTAISTPTKKPRNMSLADFPYEEVPSISATFAGLDGDDEDRANFEFFWRRTLSEQELTEEHIQLTMDESKLPTPPSDWIPKTVALYYRQVKAIRLNKSYYSWVRGVAQSDKLEPWSVDLTRMAVTYCQLMKLIKDEYAARLEALEPNGSKSPRKVTTDKPRSTRPRRTSKTEQFFANHMDTSSSPPKRRASNAPATDSVEDSEVSRAKRRKPDEGHASESSKKLENIMFDRSEADEAESQPRSAGLSSAGTFTFPSTNFTSTGFEQKSSAATNAADRSNHASPEDEMADDEGSEMSGSDSQSGALQPMGDAGKSLMARMSRPPPQDGTFSPGQQVRFGSQTSNVFGENPSPFTTPLKSHARPPFTSTPQNGSLLETPSAVYAPSDLSGVESSGAEGATGEGGDSQQSGPGLDLIGFEKATEGHEILFSVPKAKAHRYDPDENGKKDWKTQGVGPIAILQNHESGVISMLMKSEPRGAVVLNTRLSPKVEYAAMKNRVRFLVPTSKGPESWLITFKEPKQAAEFVQVADKFKTKE